MNPQDFQDLNEMADTLKEDFQDFNGEGMKVDEYGEVIEDTWEDFKNDNVEDTSQQANTPNTQVQPFALHDTPTTSHSNPPLSNSWLKRSYLAPNETDKEFELFRLYCMYGGGRSIQYICTISNATPSVLHKLSKQNNWKRRAEDYDRAELVKKLKQVQTSKHELHLRKLEKYREEQEALGQQLTLNAARIAFLANSALSKMLDEERDLDVRDLPGMLNVAAKLADVGKNLQSSSLGVDNLLAALEEAEGE